MKKFFLLFSITVLILAAMITFLPLSEASEIYDEVIRLHVIANSDSDEDQALKLCVRDTVLTELEELTSECKDIGDAYTAIQWSMDYIKDKAEETVVKNGYDYDVTAILTVEHYPTKEYEGLSLPSGDYQSLRIIIGEGSGENWWCILYPPLCTGSARSSEKLAQTGFSTNQIRLITDNDDKTYTVRFKALELFSDIKYKLKKLFN